MPTAVTGLLQYPINDVLLATGTCLLDERTNVVGLPDLAGINGQIANPIGSLRQLKGSTQTKNRA